MIPHLFSARLQVRRCAVVLLAVLAAPVLAAGRVEAGKAEQTIASRPAGDPVMAIVSLRDQRITIYDDQGWIMQAPVSSGQRDRETPAGIFTVLQKNADHYSNIYDDAFMPHMQRLTWSGIALHGGALPGYAASHGCVRLPFDFAERLFAATRLGMRVIVSPGAAEPVPIVPPVQFRPKPGAAIAAAAAAAIAEQQAAGQAEQARRAAMAAHREWLAAMAPVRKAQTLKLKAEWDAGVAEREIAAATAPGAKSAAGEARAGAMTRIAETELQLATARVELEPKAAAMQAARDAALAAEQVRAGAAAASVKAARALEPISIFISRKTQRLYVRQAREPIYDTPVTFRDADQPVGTHVFTATEGPSDLRWSAVSLPQSTKSRDKTGMTAASDSAAAALERITIPQDALDFIGERIWRRTSVIVSDEALSPETGEATEFVVTLSGEPQGSLRKRPRPAPRMEAGFGMYSRY